jgi:hypothetical protein
MKWQLVKSGNGHEWYELSDGIHTPVVLDYHLATQAARIRIEEEKRVFQVSKEGFLKNKFLFRNEYGVAMSRITWDAGEEHEGSLSFGNNRHRLQVRKDIQTYIHITGQDEIGFDCELPAGDFHTHSMLILALGWYLGQVKTPTLVQVV